MPSVSSPNRPTDRYSKIAKLIRDSYAELRNLLHSPYVDGHEIHRALLSLGHDLSGDSPEIVGETLGWRCMRLPVANVEGKPKHYLPRAVRSERTNAASLAEQVAAFIGEL